MTSATGGGRRVGLESLEDRRLLSGNPLHFVSTSPPLLSAISELLTTAVPNPTADGNGSPHGPASLAALADRLASDTALDGVGKDVHFVREILADLQSLLAPGPGPTVAGNAGSGQNASGGTSGGSPNENGGASPAHAPTGVQVLSTGNSTLPTQNVVLAPIDGGPISGSTRTSGQGTTVTPRTVQSAPAPVHLAASATPVGGHAASTVTETPAADETPAANAVAPKATGRQTLAAPWAFEKGNEAAAIPPAAGRELGVAFGGNGAEKSGTAPAADAGDAVAAEARKAGGAAAEDGDAVPAESAWPALLPQTVRDLLDRLPADARTADLALQGFLEQLELLGASSPGRNGPRALLSWLLVGVALGSLYEANRRRPRAAADGVPGADPSGSWWTDQEGSSTRRSA